MPKRKGTARTERATAARKRQEAAASSMEHATVDELAGAPPACKAGRSCAPDGRRARSERRHQNDGINRCVPSLPGPACRAWPAAALCLISQRLIFLRAHPAGLDLLDLEMLITWRELGTELTLAELYEESEGPILDQR